VPAVSRRAALALVALAFVAALLVGRFRASSASGGTPAAAAPASTTVLPPPAPARLLVHVVGAVRHPGVYQLADGARARDAVAAAGGATHRAALDGLNLAARVADGEQVVVPVRGHARPVGAPAVPGRPAIVRLNEADAAALDALPGVGPATAQRIVAWREQHGPFATVDGLLDVPGIGEAKLAAMREQLAL
jgi:competence protein ComEA